MYDQHCSYIFKGQIGFAVILLLFLYYFATILILGAEINAFFYDNYQPFSDGLGTYISQMHDEHGVGSLNKPLTDEKSEM
jgi:uncharacterized BrkB/YihY/UPF0761 family membrane protein